MIRVAGWALPEGRALVIKFGRKPPGKPEAPSAWLIWMIKA
jgi:hypothetical protein